MNEDHYKIVLEALGRFYEKRIDKLSQIDIYKILKRKNPYLYRAVGTSNANEFVEEILLDNQTASDETIFGHFFEEVAIAVSGGGYKSLIDSVDLEIRDENSIKVIAIKSGPHVFNSQSKAKQNSAFNDIRHRLSNVPITAVVGYSYGRKNRNNYETKNNFDEVAGQKFWEYITGDDDFYLKLIHMVGKAAEEHKSEFLEKWEMIKNKQYMKFMKVFCDEETGQIDWEAVVKYNSQEEKPSSIKEKIKISNSNIS